MQQTLIILCVCFVVGIGHVADAQNTTTTGNDLVEFPFQNNPCNCTLLSCNCCQAVKVKRVNFQKTVCMSFRLSILFSRADVNITVNNQTFAQFQIDPRNPPKYCVPLTELAGLALCAQLNDVKMVGFTTMQMCPIIFSNFQNNEVFAYKFPCIKLSSNGIGPARK